MWDLAILSLLLVGMCLVWYGIRIRKGLLVYWSIGLPGYYGIVSITFGLLLIAIVLYGSFIEPRIITVNEYDVELPAKNDMTIVIVSDIHVGPYKGRRFVQRVVDRIKKINPDLILLPGDFVFFGGDIGDDLLPLQDLKPKYGMYGVLGNHEYNCNDWDEATWDRPKGFDSAQRTRRALERLDINMLVNSWEEVKSASGQFFVGGVDDSCTGRDRITEAIPEIGKNSPIILMAHNPDIILEGKSKRPHLIVSGHTHGGQIRLPFIGPVTSLPTQLGRKYDQGLFEIDYNSVLAITRGVGESSPRVRLFGPPEIFVLHAKVDK